MGWTSGNQIRQVFRSLVYPGLDLHTRNRASLGRFWKTGAREVMDAGSGNGYFSWLAYKSGARVSALNYDENQVAKAREYFLGFKKADPERLKFSCRSLYELASWEQQFDEIICYETLEHVRRDQEVVREFFRLLRPDGVLHLCCPYRLHPSHLGSELDLNEAGGHVREGYTEEDYEGLLAPAGFRIDQFVGIGSPSLCLADGVIRSVRMKFGDFVALPLLPLVLPFVYLSKFNPKVPFSLYVKATKPGA